MKKMILTSLAGLSIALFSGCTEKEIVFVDANGSVIQDKPKYDQIDSTNKIVCDKRGYAYYEYNYSHRYSLTPILENNPKAGTWSTIQVKCEDL